VFAQTWPADRIESGALILFNLSMSLAVIAGCTGIAPLNVEIGGAALPALSR
jgi:hypothetical protein